MHLKSAGYALGSRLERRNGGFMLTLNDGQTVVAEKVVVVTGISYFERVSDKLSCLPSTVLSHSADNHDLSRFRGQDVLVIGRAFWYGRGLLHSGWMLIMSPLARATVWT
jgi:hypothetical protein